MGIVYHDQKNSFHFAPETVEIEALALGCGDRGFFDGALLVWEEGGDVHVVRSLDRDPERALPLSALAWSLGPSLDERRGRATRAVRSQAGRRIAEHFGGRSALDLASRGIELLERRLAGTIHPMEDIELDEIQGRGGFVKAVREREARLLAEIEASENPEGVEISWPGL